MSTHGVHGPNAPWQADDYLLTTAARADAVKLMWYHTAADVAELRRRGASKFLVRLPDSTAPGGRWKGLDEWTNECTVVVLKFRATGVARYQLDNEPNLSWPNTKEAADSWRWLTQEAIHRLRATFPNCEFGLAPFSWKPDTWGPVQAIWVPAARRVVDWFQFVNVNSYWQSSGHYNDPSFGGNVTHWHDALFPGDRRFVVAEYGCSADIPPAELEQRRVHDYPAFQAWLDTKPYVDEDYLFIIHGYGPKDWHEFWPTDRVLRVL